MIESKPFPRTFRGYCPAQVDAAVEALTTKQHFLLNDVESLRARLQERDREIAVLRTEMADLIETSPTPQAMQRRMANMLQRTVDEISQMQAEARTEADAVIAAARAEMEAEQRKHEDVIAELTAKRDALTADYEETKNNLDAELAKMRAEARAELDGERQDAKQEREQLLADAKQEADFYREKAQRAVKEAREQQIRVLEQMMGVYRDLEEVPAVLEAAYREAKDPPGVDVDSSDDHKVRAGSS
jgi:DivIVA domain-containing protein